MVIHNKSVIHRVMDVVAYLFLVVALYLFFIKELVAGIIVIMIPVIIAIYFLIYPNKVSIRKKKKTRRK